MIWEVYRHRLAWIKKDMWDEAASFGPVPHSGPDASPGPWAGFHAAYSWADYCPPPKVRRAANDDGREGVRTLLVVATLWARVSAPATRTPQSGGIGERCRSHVTGHH